MVFIENKTATKKEAPFSSNRIEGTLCARDNSGDVNLDRLVQCFYQVSTL